MGGPGSGSWYRHSKKTTLEETKRIDVRYLHQHGYLTDHCRGTLSWQRNGEPSGLINYEHCNGTIILSYRYKFNGGEWENVKQVIQVLTTPCHYGGVRKWLECPLCKRRVGILSGNGKYFACRHCYKLPYASQREGKYDRLISAKHKLGERIFEVYEHGEGWFKKKGMHQSTFDRLRFKYDWLDMKVNEALISQCERLGIKPFT